MSLRCVLAVVAAESSLDGKNVHDIVIDSGEQLTNHLSDHDSAAPSSRQQR